MRRLATDTMIMAERNLVRLPRNPDLFTAFTIQPIMFVLLFVYVFGGAISTPGYDYVDFLIPGIIVQNIAFGGFITAMGLAEDLNRGLIDRFRSLPMSRAALLAGRTLSDVATNTLSMVILIITGLIIGFSFDANVAEMMARLPGVSSAPPMPCTARARTRTSMVGATAHAIDATANSTTPATKTRRRPSRSPRDPPTRIRAARVSV